MEDRLRLVQEVAHRWYLGALENAELCASSCGCALAGIPIPAQVLWTPRRPGPRGWEALSAASIQQRRWKAESATCSSTPRVWCSKPRYTAPKFQTKIQSGCCLTRRAIALGGFRTYGSTRATRGGVEDGPKGGVGFERGGSAQAQKASPRARG